MATNEILRFAETDTGTNLLTQAEYLADAQRPIGNQPGVARSKLVNKALRQASLIAAGLAEYIADNQANNVTDALTPQNIADYLQAAITGALGVTPPQFDNDTSLATTAFVKSAGLHYSATVAKSLPATLVAGDCGANIILTGSGAVTLPSISSCPNGEALSIFNTTLSAVTINRAGADEIAVNGGAYVNSITLKPGDSIVLVSYSGSPWFAVGGTGANQFAGSFGSSLTANGYQKLPSGLIIQWGVVGSGADSGVITFPIAYTSVVYAFIGNSTGREYISYGSNNLAQINWTRSQSYAVAGASAFNWIAIGK